MSKIRDWFTLAANNNATSPDGEPEGMPRTGVNNSARERAASIKLFYDNPDMRRPFEDFTIAWINEKSFTLTDGAVENNAISRLEVGQRMRVEGTASEASKYWEGFIATVAQVSTICTITVTAWDSADSEDTDGPQLVPAYIEVGPKELGEAAWFDTGAAAGKIPAYDDLDPHVIKTEETLDVGFIDGQTREELSMAGARGRLNVNGGPEIWQRGVTFDGANSNNDDEDMCADNFMIISDGNDRVDVTRDTSTPIGVPVEFSIKMSAQPSANEKHGFVHFCERNDSGDVGHTDTTEKVSLSFWAKLGSVAGIDQLRAAVLVLKNTTPTTHPVSIWGSGSQGVLTFNSTDWALVTGGSPDGDLAVSLTGTWTEFKIEGLDMSTFSGVGPIALCLTADESTIATNMSWHVAAIQFNRGDKALPYMITPRAMELQRCYRYYEKTFPEATTPAHNAGRTGAIGQYPTGPVSGTGHLHQSWKFRAEKYKTPTIVTYNPDTAAPPTGDWASASEELLEVQSNVGTSSADLSVAAGAANNEDEVYAIHATAHANIRGNN